MVMRSSVSYDITPCCPLKSTYVSEKHVGHIFRFWATPYFMMVSYLAYCSTLKMEAACLSGTSVDFQQTTHRYVPEDGKLRRHRNLCLRAQYRRPWLPLTWCTKQVSLFTFYPRPDPELVCGTVILELYILSRIMDNAQVKCRSKSLQFINNYGFKTNSSSVSRLLLQVAEREFAARVGYPHAARIHRSLP
jgi:hypothetical protein